MRYRRRGISLSYSLIGRRGCIGSHSHESLLGCRPPDPLQDGGPISFRFGVQGAGWHRYPDISHPWRNLSHLRENLSHPCRNDSAVGGSGCHPWRNCSHLGEKCCHRGQISSHLWEEDSAVGENGCHPWEKGSAAGHIRPHARQRFSHPCESVFIRAKRIALLCVPPCPPWLCGSFS
jgi:hypothetical protein